MTIKQIIYALLPLKLKVLLFRKKSINAPCGYGKPFSIYIEQAFNTFLTAEEMNNQKLIKRLTNDLIASWLKYKALPYEYFLFDFRNKKDKQRATFLTDMDRLPVLARLFGTEEFFRDINDKYNFYCKMKSFFSRNAYCVHRGASVEEFVEFALSSKDIFVKLISGSKGFGAISRSINSEEEAVTLYNELLEKGDNWIAEERVQQSSYMAQWCTSCVNTVRIPSFMTSKGLYILDPFFRTGHEGSIVDNAGQGGVFAVADPLTGVLITDGVDEYGRFYKKHPDSHLVFKGWQIPFWNELVDIVKHAHEQFPNQKYIGWDFALNKDNKWVLIEGNRGQMVGQYATKKGIKKEFYKYLYL